MADTPREPLGDARRLLLAAEQRERQIGDSYAETAPATAAAHYLFADALAAGARALAAPKLPCTCGPPSFPYQEHDGDCPRGLAEAVPPAPAGLTHSLTLEFRRILSEAEWREVVEKARQLPYVQGLRADAEDTP